jgi:hypothetical protein
MKKTFLIASMFPVLISIGQPGGPPPPGPPPPPPTQPQRFSGAVLTGAGDSVIFIPYNHTNIGIYNISNNTYTNGPAHGLGSAAFVGGTLIEDGRIIMAPYDAASVGIYDPVLNSFTNSNSHGQGSEAFSGAVITPNRRVVLIPRNSPNIGLYDVDLNLYTNGPAHGLGADAFVGGTIMPDGKIFMSTSSQGVAGIYDSHLNTFSTVSTTNGTQRFAGAVLYGNGKIIMIPYGNDRVGIFSGSGFSSIPQDGIFSRLFNKF